MDDLNVEALNRGPVRRPRHTTSGQLALLVLVDSSGPYHSRSIVDETVLVLLEHMGFPYRLLDLATQRPTAELLVNCGALVVAQEGVCGRLTEAESRLLAAAVSEGMGLVNMDWDLRQQHGPLLEVFGFEGVDPRPIASNLYLVPANDHYITWLQPSRAFHQSQRMVTALAIDRWGADVTPLAEAVLGKDQLVYIRHLVPGNAYEPRHYPVIFAGRWRRGKAVQFAVNPRLWRRGALGHPGGMSDLLWRSIVWTVRKPFVANMIPPFVTMSFDDCTGRHDFAYLDACARHSYVPLVGIFLDHMQAEYMEDLGARLRAGEILVNSHGGSSYYRRFSYDFGIGEYTEEELARNFAEEDAFYEKFGLEHSRTVRGHFGEIGTRALPYLKERGRTLLCTGIHIGEHKADQFPADGYWPYNSLRCFYDYLPDDNDFMIFGAFNERHLVDFLTGATIWLREASHNDIERASDRAAEQYRNGLGNGFFAEVLTHEQKLTVLSLDEWARILARTEEKVARFEPIFAGHDEIGDYIRSKDGTWLSQANLEGGQAICTLEGRANQSLKLSLFEDVDDGVERRFVTVPPFEGESATRLL